MGVGYSRYVNTPHSGDIVWSVFSPEDGASCDTSSSTNRNHRGGDDAFLLWKSCLILAIGQGCRSDDYKYCELFEALLIAYVGNISTHTLAWVPNNARKTPKYRTPGGFV